MKRTQPRSNERMRSVNTPLTTPNVGHPDKQTADADRSNTLVDLGFDPQTVSRNKLVSEVGYQQESPIGSLVRSPGDCIWVTKSEVGSPTRLEIKSQMEVDFPGACVSPVNRDLRVTDADRVIEEFDPLCNAVTSESVRQSSTTKRSVSSDVCRNKVRQYEGDKYGNNSAVIRRYAAVDERFTSPVASSRPNRIERGQGMHPLEGIVYRCQELGDTAKLFVHSNHRDATQMSQQKTSRSEIYDRANGITVEHRPELTIPNKQELLNKTIDFSTVSHSGRQQLYEADLFLDHHKQVYTQANKIDHGHKRILPQINRDARDAALKAVFDRCTREVNRLGYDWQRPSVVLEPHVSTTYDSQICVANNCPPNDSVSMHDGIAVERRQHCLPNVVDERSVEPSEVRQGHTIANDVEDVHRYRKDTMKPQTFDGKEPISSFIAHFEVCAHFNGWSNEQKVSWLKWSLKGRAQQILWDLPPTQLTSYESIVSSLRQRFGSDSQSEVYKLELRSRRRGPHESLSDLMQDIRRLMVLAYSATTSEMWESVAINAFLEALDDSELALEVRKRGPTSLDAAYRDALLLEGYQKASVKNETGKGRSHVRITTDVTTELRRELQDMRKEVEQQEKKHAQTLEKLTQHYEQLVHEHKNFAATSAAKSPQNNGSSISRSAECSSGREEKPINGVCFQCGKSGHLKRNCPQKQRSVTKVTPPQSSRHIVGSRSAYLPATIFGEKRWCLLDTGSEISVVPSRYVPIGELKPSAQVLNAANGTTIDVLGEVDVNLDLGPKKVSVSCLVSEHVDEILLGLTFLEENACIWDFSKRTITICGTQFKLFAQKPSYRVRRLVLQDDTILQPRCQQAILAKTIYSSLAKSTIDWATRPTELTTGVYLARAIVCDRPVNVPLQVINTTDHEVHLKKGLHLGGLEEVQPAHEISNQTTENKSDMEHLDDVINSIDNSITENDRMEFIRLLQQYETIFSKGEHDLGLATAVRHRIDTGSNQPVRQALRRQPAHYAQEIDRQVEELLAQGRIEPSQSEWASNIVIVRKKDGSLRFCVDLRQVNERTVKDAYPLPRIDHCLDCLGGAIWYSTMDLRSGYHQVAMDDRDKGKTTFVTRRGAYAFNVMPYGLCNAPATFQRLMDCTMRGLNFEICLIYLDDIIVFSADIPTHLQRLKQVFERLLQVNLKLKPSKCAFLRRSVEFLGFSISADGIKTDNRKIQAIIDWPIPKKLREVRGFLGLCGYYRKFVDNFSDIAAPLHALTKKNVQFSWSEGCQISFDALKKKLTEAPILALPCDNGDYVLDTDASDHGIGAVLSQIQDGKERVICYASRLYSAAEKRYCVTRKELLAVVYFVKNFRQYLLGRSFILRTDHSALQWLRRTPEPIGQQGRWLEILEEYNFTVEHRPGAKHANADAMSRRPCRQCGQCGEVESECRNTVNVNTVGLICQIQSDWAPEALSTAQAQDPDIGPIQRALTEGSSKPEWEEMLPCSQETKTYWTQWESLSLLDNVLYRRHIRKDGLEFRQLVAPPKYRSEIMRQAHAGFTAGHMGERRTLDQVRRRAYWAGWAADTRRMIRTCQECCKYKRGAPPRQGHLQNMSVGMPWERVGVDVTGPHPKSRNGYTYILTLVDYFSKWAEAFPIRNQEAATVAKVLLDRVIACYGMPLQILTDRGTNFESQLFNELCRCLDIDHIRTTAYKPSTNGLVERFHRTLNSILGKVVADHQRDWDQHLPYAVAAYRATVHETTGYSPNYLFLGREVRAPLDLIMGQLVNENHERTSLDEYVDRRLHEMRESYRVVRDRLRKAANRTKRYYDMRVREAKFNPGDKVWLWSPRRIQGRKLKWQRCYTGPFTVVKQTGPVNYCIQRSAKSKRFTVHVDKLKLYTEVVNGGQEEAGPVNASNDKLDGEIRNKETDDIDGGDELQVANYDDHNVRRRVLPPRCKQLPARYRV